METNKTLNVVQLRNELLSDFNELKNGNLARSTAETRANIAGKAIASAKIQLEYNKFVGDKNPIEFLKG